MVDRLIQAGANANIANHTGKTPLMKAAELGDGAIVTLLIDSGAILNKHDHLGKDAHWSAKKMGHEAIAEYLNSLKRLSTQDVL